MKEIKVLTKKGKIQKMSIHELILKYENLINKIAKHWLYMFSFDNAITKEDLSQELKLKLLKGLESYDYRKNSSIAPFITKIATNHLISYLKRLTAKNHFPKNLDEKAEAPISIHSLLKKGRNNQPTELIDVLPNIELVNTLPKEEFLADELLLIKEAYEKIKEDLNKIPYRPANFQKRLRSFTRVVFDLIIKQDKKFTDFVIKDFKQRRRIAKRDNRSIPHVITIRSQAIAKYLNVNKRCVELAFQYIKKTIAENLKEII